MDAEDIQVGKRYYCAAKKRGIHGIVACRAVHVAERTNEAEATYLHVTVDVELADGSCVNVGPASLKTAKNESYRPDRDEHGIKIVSWQRLRRRELCRIRRELWTRPADEFDHMDTHPMSTVSFNHMTEVRMAQLLDSLGIAWQHERCGFRLSTGGFLPDFYLAELDLFVEITVAGESAKRTKLNSMARECSEVRVIALCAKSLTDALKIDSREEMIELLEAALDRQQRTAERVREAARRGHSMPRPKKTKAAKAA